MGALIFFHSDLDDFYFLFLYDCCARISNIMFNKSGKSGHPTYLRFYRKSFQFGIVGHDVSCGLVINDLYSFRICPLIFTLIRVYIRSECWILSNASCACVELAMWFFILPSVNVVYCIDWFVNIEASFHPLNKTHQSQCIILFIYFVYILLNLIC